MKLLFWGPSFFHARFLPSGPAKNKTAKRDRKLNFLHVSAPRKPKGPSFYFVRCLFLGGIFMTLKNDEINERKKMELAKKRPNIIIGIEGLVCMYVLFLGGIFTTDIGEKL